MILSFGERAASRRSSSRFTLIQTFEDLYRGNVYKHRDSSLGNFVAAHLYEDLYSGGFSSKFNKRVDDVACVVNVSGSIRGVKARRGDGTFGNIVPGSNPAQVSPFLVRRGMVALTHIGTEVKIIATAHLKQIDRVMNDLTGSARSLREKSSSAITVGIAGVNYSESWTGMEGERQFPRVRRSDRAAREAEETARRLEERCRPTFDEFLLLRFKATNNPPYPFDWLDPSGVQADYGAALVRIADRYERLF